MKPILLALPASLALIAGCSRPSETGRPQSKPPVWRAETPEAPQAEPLQPRPSEAPEKPEPPRRGPDASPRPPETEPVAVSEILGRWEEIDETGSGDVEQDEFLEDGTLIVQQRVPGAVPYRGTWKLTGGRLRMNAEFLGKGAEEVAQVSVKGNTLTLKYDDRVQKFKKVAHFRNAPPGAEEKK